MKKKIFARLLNEVIACALVEVQSGESSMWDINIIENTILPEMRELLLYACKGIVLFTTEPSHGRLKSTEIIENSTKQLNDTELGRLILKVQKIYTSFHNPYSSKRPG